MRIPVLCLCLALISLPALAKESHLATGYARAASLSNCKRPYGIYGTTEAICRNPDLLEEYDAIHQEFLRMARGFHGDDRLLFATQQGYWVFDLEQCAPEERVGKYPSPEVFAKCLKPRFDQRKTYFAAVKADPSLLRTKAADYTSVDFWYVKRFAKQYAGKHIDVVMGIEDDSPICDLKSLHASMINSEGDHMDAEFEKAGSQAKFFCNKPVEGPWDGVEVRLDGKGQPYLRISAADS